MEYHEQRVAGLARQRFNGVDRFFFVLSSGSWAGRLHPVGRVEGVPRARDIPKLRRNGGGRGDSGLQREHGNEAMFLPGTGVSILPLKGPGKQV